MPETGVKSDLALCLGSCNEKTHSGPVLPGLLFFDTYYRVRRTTLNHTEVVHLIDFEKNPRIMLILRIPERESSYSYHSSAEDCSTGPGEIGEESEESGEPDS